MIGRRSVRRDEARGVRRFVVGVISDTHGLLRPEAVAALQGADLIVHAGDIGSEAVLRRLREMAPVIAVRGNNDREAWAASLPDVVVTEVAGARLCVIHDLKGLRLVPAREGIDVVIAGHSHRPSVERRGRLLLLNPGSAGPRRFTLPVALARLYVRPGRLDARIVTLTVASPPTTQRPRRRATTGTKGSRAASDTTQ